MSGRNPSSCQRTTTLAAKSLLQSWRMLSHRFRDGEAANRADFAILSALLKKIVTLAREFSGYVTVSCDPRRGRLSIYKDKPDKRMSPDDLYGMTGTARTQQCRRGVGDGRGQSWECFFRVRRVLSSMLELGEIRPSLLEIVL